MATEKPRITITLEHHQHKILSRVAMHQGRSMSAIVGELVAAVTPSFQRVEKLLVEAQMAPAQAVDGLVAGVERAEQRLGELVRPVLKQQDLFTPSKGATATRAVPSLPARGAAKGRAQAKPEATRVRLGGRRSQDPRPVNTGVRSRKSGQPAARRR